MWWHWGGRGDFESCVLISDIQLLLAGTNTYSTNHNKVLHLITTKYVTEPTEFLNIEIPDCDSSKNASPRNPKISATA
jgi:hypothetical protein